MACARHAAGLSTQGGDAEATDADPWTPAGPAAEPDWARVLELADHHGLTLLLNRYLGRDAPVFVPDPVLDRLRARARLRTRDNLRLTAELVELSAAMEAAGIETIAYKGPVLSTRVFGDPSLRDYDDLDLLVRPRDVEAASRLLERRGLKPWFEVRGDREQRLPDSQYARHFGDVENRLAVDLHWGFSQPYLSFAIDEARIWETSETVPVGGRLIRTIPGPLLLLILCIHGSKHEPFPWNRLKWIVDVAALMTGVDRAEWPAVLDHARELRLERPLLFGLLVANRLLGAQLAPAVRDRMAHAPVLDRLALDAIGSLTSGEDDAGAARTRLDYDLRLLDRRRDRARYVLHRLFVPNPKDWASFELPRGMAAAYYLLRPVRLVRAGLSRLPGPS